MGQKINPISLRLGINTNWRSRWFADGKAYTEYLHEDLAIRRLIAKRLDNAGVAQIEIERHPGELTVIIHTARPGVVIGRGGAGTSELKQLLEKKFLQGKTGEKGNVRVKIDIVEIRQPETNAQLIAENIKYQLEKRVMFKRAMRQAAEKAMVGPVRGVRMLLAGRLGGAEIARSEKLSQGSVPLSTLRAKLDYGFAEANTTYGTIGIKIWLYKGDQASLNLEPPAARRISA